MVDTVGINKVGINKVGTDTVEMDGFTLVRLTSERVELLVAPELGGKWVSLRDLHTGREWMWSPPAGRRLFRAPDNNAFHRSSLVGADECLPTIAPCTWQGRSLPDHGEVWNITWDVIESTGDVLTLAVNLPVSPLRVQRRIRLDGTILEVAYTLENLGDASEAFVWAFHPLFTIEPGDRLMLGDSVPGDSVQGDSVPGDSVQGDGVRELLVESAIGLDLGQRGDGCAWPSPQAGVNLRDLDLGADGRAAKFFTHPLRQGQARIDNVEGRGSLTYAFDTQEIDTLGIWLTQGGWNGYHHLAVEPGIGAPDPLDVAVEDWERFGTVPSGGATTWRFYLTVGDTVGD